MSRSRSTEESPYVSPGDAQQSSRSSDSNASVQVSLDRILALESRVRDLADMVMPAEPTAPSLRNEDGELAGVIKQTDDQLQEPVVPHIGYLSKQGGGKFRYVDPAFWAAMVLING